MNSTFNAFRELQQRWRETGIVPQANVKELWETYNLHVENFYNYIKINKELRDLDLKRNYEAKVQLCEAAEALMLEPSIVTAFRKLQDLHDQWRETGPVANEYKEALWERFKEASTRINKQHQEYFEKLKEEQRHNLELKTELCVKVEELSSEILTTRKEWNKASERLIEIQKVWKTIGFAPQKDNARIYERFRNACDKFFEQETRILRTAQDRDGHQPAAQDRNMRTGRIAAGERTVEEDDRRTDSAPEKMERDWSRTAPLFGCRLEAVPRSVRPFLRTQVSPLLRRGRPARGEPAGGKTGAADGDGSGRHQRRRIRNDKGVPKTLERNRVRTPTAERRGTAALPGRDARSPPCGAANANAAWTVSG